MIRLSRTTAFVFDLIDNNTDFVQLERMIGVGLIEEVDPIPAAARPAPQRSTRLGGARE